jgi:signal transduction histidine kinase
VRKFKTLLATVWFFFVVSLVGWWWIYFMNTIVATNQEMNRSHRMFMWEGSILLAALVIGGLALIFLSYRDEKRHAQLRTFFATFSHDIKTSITRLRLQAEVLEEDGASTQSPVLQRLIKDIARLDLQLENSLLLSTTDAENLLSEKMLLSKLIESMRIQWSELDFRLQQDAEITADKRAMVSVLRNIIHNSVLHGQATAIEFAAKVVGNNQVEITVQDNGKGFNGDVSLLGAEVLPSKNERGNGIGLYLCRRLLKKMNGDLRFEQASPGLRAVIRINGRPL